MAAARVPKGTAGGQPRHADATARLRLLWWGLIGAIILGAVVSAWQLHWIGDDAFVTLRYVDQWFQGEGIVYNPGERVEGYTHFLWLLVLAGVRLVGFDPVTGAQAVGIACFGVALALTAVASSRIQRRSVLFVPYTLLALALHFDFKVWMTGGLETALFTLEVVAALLVFFFNRWSSRRRLLVGGALFGLMAMTRPDAVLFHLWANLCTALHGWRRRRGLGRTTSDLLRLNLPFAALVLPWLAWKYAYYGALLPNTFHAKDAGLVRFEQGLYYLGHYAGIYVSVWLLAVPLILLAHRTFRKARRGPEPADAWRAEDDHHGFLPVALGAVLLYITLFIVRVGGDFMFARFMVPLLPPIYLLIEAAVHRMWGRRVWPTVGTLVVLLALSPVELHRRQEVFPSDRRRPPDPELFTRHRGIIDEHWYYTATYMRGHRMTLVEYQRTIGEEFRPHFEDLEIRILGQGQNIMAYYGRFPYVVGMYGLTDREIARQSPVVSRNRRIGHEKELTYDDVVRRGIHLKIAGGFAGMPQRSYRRMRVQISEGFWVECTILTWDEEIMTALKRSFGDRIRFEDFTRHLDRYIDRELTTRTTAQVEEDYQEFRDFYFRHNDDSRRARAFLDRLRQ